MAKGSKKTKSESDKRFFSSYNGEKKRELRLNRHRKNHPNDSVAAKAKPTYRRRKPINKGGWVTRAVSDKLYIGKLPGKDDTAIGVLNDLKPSDQKKMAHFSKVIRKIHNRLEYEKEDKSLIDKKKKLGYAG